MKSTRIKRLKTLQHLARKYGGQIELIYRVNLGVWLGRFYYPENKVIGISRNTFNEMLNALHTKVRCELAKSMEEEA